jgi:hypothetical protein
VGLLLVVGVQLWLIVGRGQYGSSPRLVWYVPMVLLAGIPFFARRLDRALDWVRHPSHRVRAWTAVAIAIGATIYLISTAFYQHRDLVPKLHDDYMHLVQAQLLARGRLWMTQHPVADSFESFLIFVKPVYAGIYFPGASLLMVPGVWLGLAFWVVPVIACGCAVGVLYRVISEMIDGVAGILASLLLVSLTEFRYVSMAAMSHGIMVLWGLSLVWAWLRWRRTPTLRWALALGVFAGWGLITRPVDAVAMGIPVGLAMLVRMREWPMARSARHLGAAALAALPFIALQLLLNYGVSGNPLRLAYGVYNELYTPGASMGFRQFDPNAKLATTLPQRVNYYNWFTVPAVKEHRLENVWQEWKTDRLRRLVKWALPSALLLILIPAGLMAIDRRTGVLVAMLPLYLIGYAQYPYFLSHYSTLAAPALILLALLGVKAVAEAAGPLRSSVVVFSVLWIVSLSLRALPEVDPLVRDDWYMMRTVQFNWTLESKIQGRAIVLYHYNPVDSPHDEPVFNVKTAWPDDARIIRAHDLGIAQNRKLFEYYAKIQPDRKVYWVDRVDGQNKLYDDSLLKYLGTVQELAAR